ncbi:unnamed protein product [Rotaria sordida]|uniref:Uncharacterized protein n=1 Tax=Rotaria sordida TaxID=392033 RepID=A0A815L637_9BILA|nr:unnamed protein product [Rotaria sordida]
MSTKRQATKRHRSEINKATNSIDLSSDLEFLTEYINVHENPLSLLISSRIINSSFSNLYQRSCEIGWKELFIEERSKLKLDEKSKPKRFMFNRLIYACSKNTDNFEQQAQTLNEEIKRQMSNKILSEQDYDINFPIIDYVYAEVETWRQMQRERRLFYKKYNALHSLLTLQRLMTDHFLNLFHSLTYEPNFLKSGGRDAFRELFHYSLIIVAQPSGTDCIAATKYEKFGKDFLAKIKTRIICLLDLNKIGKYLEYSNIDVILYPKNRNRDPDGDVQSSLQWKIRTIINSEQEEQTFFYVELNENSPIKLTKMNSNQKPLYNNGLCQLEFRTKFKIIGYDIEEILTLNSQLFGLCSHAKYYPTFLAKVFIDEIEQWYKNIILETHINILIGYICKFHKRISGVEIEPHTQQFIEEELQEVFNLFLKSASPMDAPVMIFSFEIYQNILKKLFTQIKFLSNHPFLSMILFHGICSDKIDKKLNNYTQQIPQMIMRFEQFKNEGKTEHPNIIFVFYHGTLRKSRTTHEYFIDDISRCLCKAANNDRNQLQVFNDDKTIPFNYFRWYHDNDLNRDNLIQTDDEIIYYPLPTLLQGTM